jgi:hypothetical protein
VANSASEYVLKVQTLKNDTVEKLNVRLPGISLRNFPPKLKLKEMLMNGGL